MSSLKILLKIGFTAILAFLLQKIFPWWSVGIASFLISFIISTKGRSSFLSGFIAIALLWFLLALLVDMRTDSILSGRIAELFSLPGPGSLMMVTALIGGLFGGFAALAGSHIRSWILPSES